jgi:thiol-disulfide isomerase/thioredoxin
MLTMKRILVGTVVAAACVAGCAGMAAAWQPAKGATPQKGAAPQKPVAPEKAAASPKAAASELKLNEMFDRPQVWPDDVVLKRALFDGKTETKAGTAVKVYNVERAGVIVAFPKSDELTQIQFDASDFVEKANAVYATLPDEAKKLTLTDLLNRTDLMPPTVKLIEEVTFPDKVRKAGMDIGPYKLFRASQGIQLMAIDPELVKKGTINARQTYFLEATDFRKQLRATMLTRLAAKDSPKEGDEADKAAAEASRIFKEIKGRLVDSSGKTLADPDKPAKFYAIYSTAAWCGWCSKFDPELIKFYDEAKAKKQDVEVIYLSADKSEKEMLDHMKESKMKYPAVKYDQRFDTPYMIGLVSGATPHLVVVTGDGRLVHDGNPAGMNGAQAALGVLKRELAKGK